LSLDNKSPEELNAYFMVCGEHFEDKMFMNALTRDRLVHNAVPTICNFPQTSSSACAAPKKRKPPNERNTVVSLKKSRTDYTAGLTENLPIPRCNSPETVTAAPPSTIEITPRKAALTSKLYYAKACLNRARVALYRQKKPVVNGTRLANSESRLTGARGGACNTTLETGCYCSVCLDLNSLQQSQRQFFLSQLRACKFSKYGMRFTTQDKLLALGLYYKSPSAYRFMGSTFHLPSERTLQSYIGSLNIGCGFKSDYVQALRKKVDTMLENEKCCVLTFDGMALKSKLQYVESQDVIAGFLDLDEFGDRSAEVAKQALQYMVRGISTRWKQPLGHFFGGTVVKAETLKDMTMKAVSLLEDIGLSVMAVVCDQEASHRVLYNLLGATNDEPWFKSQRDNKVYVLYDIPHLIKNLRNNLLNYDIISATGEPVASFAVIRRLYDLEKMSSLRLCPKLTDGHVNLKPFKKMKVSLATQVLSHSVGSAIRTYVSLKKLPESSLSTANFVETVDQVFDVLNSRVKQPNHKWRKPLTIFTHDQFILLDDAVAWIGSWRFRHVSKQTVKQSLPFQQGLVLTIRAVGLLVKDLLHNRNFKYVFTSRFNQDIVENWFSCIRQKGLNNDSRTAWEYESAGRAISVNWMLRSTSNTSNCQLDFDYFVGVMSKLSEQKKPSTWKDSSFGHTAQSEVSASNESALIASSSSFPLLEGVEQKFAVADSIFDELPITDWSQSFKLTPTDDSVVCYLAGYLMKKCRERFHCQQCCELYELSSERSQGELYGSDEARLDFIRFKTYDWAKHGLLAPSRQFYEFCASVEKIIQMNIEQVSSGRNVSQNLKECILATVDVSSYSVDSVCDEHQQQQREYMLSLLLRVRIHHFVRIRNRDLQELNRAHKLKVNRKAKKVMNK
jgi:hypothetical protein